jgi:hypothetical protein
MKIAQSHAFSFAMTWRIRWHSSGVKTFISALSRFGRSTLAVRFPIIVRQ